MQTIWPEVFAEVCLMGSPYPERSGGVKHANERLTQVTTQLPMYKGVLRLHKNANDGVLGARPMSALMQDRTLFFLL